MPKEGMLEDQVENEEMRNDDPIVRHVDDDDDKDKMSVEEEEEASTEGLELMKMTGMMSDDGFQTIDQRDQIAIMSVVQENKRIAQEVGQTSKLLDINRGVVTAMEAVKYSRENPYDEKENNSMLHQSWNDSNVRVITCNEDDEWSDSVHLSNQSKSIHRTTSSSS